MLQHYLVLKSSGVPLFSFTNKLADPHYNNTNIVTNGDTNTSMIDNSILFSGLLSSFVKFSKELGGSLQQIKLDNVDLYTYEHEDLIGVSLAEPSKEPSQTKIYETATEIMTKTFVNDFENELNNFSGNVSVFANFEDKINKAGIMDGKLKLGKICKTCVIDCCSGIKNIISN